MLPLIATCTKGFNDTRAHTKVLSMYGFPCMDHAKLQICSSPVFKSRDRGPVPYPDFLRPESYRSAASIMLDLTYTYDEA